MFFKDDAVGVIDLETPEDLDSIIGLDSVTGIGAKNEDDVMTSDSTNNQPNEPGGKVQWDTPLIKGPGTGHTRSGRVIKAPDRLTYTPAVELRYLGEMAELDHVELANTYMALRSMEMALIGAGVGGGISHTSQLKVLNYKKAMQSPDADEWHKENIMPLLLSQEIRYQRVRRFSLLRGL